MDDAHSLVNASAYLSLVGRFFLSNKRVLPILCAPIVEQWLEPVLLQAIIRTFWRCKRRLGWVDTLPSAVRLFARMSGHGAIHLVDISRINSLGSRLLRRASASALTSALRTTAQFESRWPLLLPVPVMDRFFPSGHFLFLKPQTQTGLPCRNKKSRDSKQQSDDSSHPLARLFSRCFCWVCPWRLRRNR